MMSVKTLMLLLAVVAFSNVSYSQSKYGANPEDSLSCLENLSLLQEFMKQSDYESAYRAWNKVYTLCPGSSKNIYIYGTQIFNHRIGAEKNEAVKTAQIDSLYTVYDRRVEYFAKGCYVMGRKGMDMMRFSPDDVEGYYTTLKGSVDECGVKSEAYVLSSYYSAIYNMYKAEKLEKEILLTEYVEVMGHIDQNLANLTGTDKKTETKRSYYEAAKTSVNDNFFKVAECPEIESIMSKLIEESPEDFDLKKSALKIFDKKDCSDSPVYLQVAESVHRQEPSHESAYSLGMIYAKKKQFSKALDYLKEAIELCVDCPEQTKYLEKAGQIASAAGSHGTARSYANKLLQLDPGNSDAYVLIGNAIAASGKGCAEPQSWGVNWLAYDYYAKAGAKSRMNQCAARFPTKSKAFFYQLNAGQSFKVDCNGLSESTTVRTQ